jgi:hypothetical protein
MKKSEKVSTAVAVLKICVCVSPNIECLLKILSVIPVTTSTSERSFSSLKRIKTYVRSTVGQVRLNGLAMFSVNKN